MIVLLVTVILVAVDLLALHLGVDSRDTATDHHLPRPTSQFR
jgi:hypothetical protein